MQSVERAVYIRGRGGEEDIGPVTADLGCPGVAAVGGGEGEGAGGWKREQLSAWLAGSSFWLGCDVLIMRAWTST